MKFMGLLGFESPFLWMLEVLFALMLKARARSSAPTSYPPHFIFPFCIFLVSAISNDHTKPVFHAGAGINNHIAQLEFHDCTLPRQARLLRSLRWSFTLRVEYLPGSKQPARTIAALRAAFWPL